MQRVESGQKIVNRKGREDRANGPVTQSGATDLATDSMSVAFADVLRKKKKE